MAEALGMVILLIAAANLLLYAGTLLCLIAAFRVWKSNRAVAALLLLAGVLPFLHYTVQAARAQYEPVRRAKEIRAWSASRAATGQPPRSIELLNTTQNDELAGLVAAGALDEIQVAAPHPRRGSFVYTMVEGPQCISFADSQSSRAEFRRAVLARHAFLRCVRRTERASPPNATLQLFFGRNAPSRYKGAGCLGGGSRATLELRWSASRGGQQFAFWEPPDFIPLAFPPRLMGDGRMWGCAMLHPDDQRYSFADPFRFTASALGFNTPEDFPRSSHPNAPIEALRLLRGELRSAYAQDRVVALLGQWPSNPQITHEFRDPSRWLESNRWLAAALALLTDPAQDERRRTLYPHLGSHRPMLVAFCERATAGAGQRMPAPCRVLLRASDRQAAARG